MVLKVESCSLLQLYEPDIPLTQQDEPDELHLPELLHTSVPHSQAYAVQCQRIQLSLDEVNYSACPPLRPAAVEVLMSTNGRLD